MTFEVMATVDYEGVCRGELIFVQCSHHKHFEDMEQARHAISGCLRWVSEIFGRPAYMDSAMRVFIS